MNTQELLQGLEFHAVMEDDGEREFDLDSVGRIKNLGKFEGCSPAVPYFYNLMLDGEGSIIQIEETDRKRFQISREYNFVVVFEDSQGFCSIDYFHTRPEAEAAEEEDRGDQDDDDYTSEEDMEEEW